MQSFLRILHEAVGKSSSDLLTFRNQSKGSHRLEALYVAMLYRELRKRLARSVGNVKSCLSLDLERQFKAKVSYKKTLSHKIDITYSPAGFAGKDEHSHWHLVEVKLFLGSRRPLASESKGLGWDMEKLHEIKKAYNKLGFEITTVVVVVCLIEGYAAEQNIRDHLKFKADSVILAKCYQGKMSASMVDMVGYG